MVTMVDSKPVAGGCPELFESVRRSNVNPRVGEVALIIA